MPNLDVDVDVEVEVEVEVDGFSRCRCDVADGGSSSVGIDEEAAEAAPRTGNGTAWSGSQGGARRESLSLPVNGREPRPNWIIDAFPAG